LPGGAGDGRGLSRLHGDWDPPAAPLATAPASRASRPIAPPASSASRADLAAKLDAAVVAPYSGESCGIRRND